MNYNHFIKSLIATIILIHFKFTNAFITNTKTQSKRPVTSLKSSLSSSKNANSKLKHMEKYDYEILSTDPLVYHVNNVLSKGECESFIKRIDNEGDIARSNAPEVSLDTAKLWPLPFLCIGASIPKIMHLFQESSSPTLQDIALVALPPILLASAVSFIMAYSITQLIRIKSDSTSRTSDALALNTNTDFELIRPLVNKIQGITKHEWRKFEAPVVTRYQPGALFATHNDASPTRGSEWSDLGGQRVVTAITYLNDCPRGGGTSFDRLKLTVQPRQGCTLIFFPADETTLLADDRTRHESLPAVEQKYIVQMFGRLDRVPPPLGLLESFECES